MALPNVCVSKQINDLRIRGVPILPANFFLKNRRLKTMSKILGKEVKI